MTDANPDLESFREQWRAEVSARARGSLEASKSSGPSRRKSSPRGTSATRAPSNLSAPPPLATERPREGEEEDFEEPQTYHDLVDKDEFRTLESRLQAQGNAPEEPQSALEHYEKAVERETQGNLGDSLNHYRKAFRLDSAVDKTYKNKYFPPTTASQKPSNINPSTASATVPNTAHHSLQGSTTEIAELINSFSNLSIPTPPPTTPNTSSPATPISALPSEILLDILTYLAILDVASFARLSQVCKRLAYLVATQDHIWKRVCLGPEHGFGGMHYAFSCAVDGHPLPTETEDHLLSDPDEPPHSIPPSPPTLLAPSALPLTPAYPTYRSTFRHRPRIRFNGCYISTVNYVRPGASSPTQVSWNTPVHIVTYYRYLRFFRDGTALSLLTTAEPADVVHHLTKDNLALHAGGGGGGLPSAVMRHALRGRWRLSGDPLHENKNIKPAPSSLPPASSSSTTTSPPPTGGDEAEGDVHIETEGPAAHYLFAMHLSLRSTTGRGAAPRNNKLAWRGFWSYNTLTDDWAGFSLRNDRAFFWSRVRSFGMG
ncbi:MAG: hypothetical protein M1833_000985 [Piccolia ochrophora]|nr:MAG: hypothetical protein M1833_000985 [Piccolia ochrophora]